MCEGSKHSTLTEGRRRGLPLDHPQKAAGHKDSRSTEIYADFEQEQATRVLRPARKSRSAKDQAITYPGYRSVLPVSSL